MSHLSMTQRGGGGATLLGLAAGAAAGAHVHTMPWFVTMRALAMSPAPLP